MTTSAAATSNAKRIVSENACQSIGGFPPLNLGHQPAMPVARKLL
jgi:hypothetical protein